MTVINATAGQSGAGGYANPAVAVDLRSYGPFIGWPGIVTDMSAASIVTVTQVAAAAHPLAVASVAGGSYMADFYYRIYLMPGRLDLGNLVTAQVRTVAVWNAWPDQSLTLTSVEASNAEGITADASGGFPMVFGPLQVRTWSISVSTDGPPVIDAALRWQFAGLDPVQITITGSRITAWFIAPDWSDALVETLTWLTDVQQSVTGSEVRQAARGAPRRQWEFAAVVDGNDRQLMETALYDWSSRTWALPVWVDATWLAAALPAASSAIALDTTGHDYVPGGLVMLYGGASRYELAQVDTVAAGSLALQRPTLNAWPAGTRVLPCRTAQLTDYPQLRRHSDRVLTTQLRFQAAEECDWTPAAPPTLYLGLPVLETRTNEPEDLTVQYKRQVNRIDNDIGAVVLDDPSGVTWPTQPFYWLLQGRAERAALRGLLYWLQGRGNALWVPSWSDDVSLAAPVAANATTLTIDAIGYTGFLRQRPGRRHLRIELFGGQVFYRRITGATAPDTATEVLAIDSAPGIAIDPAQVRQINWLMLMRLADDAVELHHTHDSEGIASAAVNFIAVPQEEP